MSLGPELERLIAGLAPPAFEGTPARRTPSHVLYGGADRFAPDVVTKLGRIALATLDDHAASADDVAWLLGIPAERIEERRPLAESVYAAARAKLVNEPIEDLRVDFEDGYGVRTDDEETAHASRAGATLVALERRPLAIGIRVKPLDGRTGRRALGTLDAFVTSVVEHAKARGAALEDVWGSSFVVTLPKITSVDELGTLARALGLLEARHAIAPGTLGIEAMVETRQSLTLLDQLRAASDGRLRGVHLGSYDLTSSLGVEAPYQTADHPYCTATLLAMARVFGESDVSISDGATNVLPISRATDRAVAVAEVRRALALHIRQIQRSFRLGVTRGWDLHPAQLAARHLAVLGHYLEHEHAMAPRLAAFRAALARASTSASDFDDAATGRGLVRFFVRGHHAGAFSRARLEALGIALRDDARDVLDLLDTSPSA